MMSLVGCSGEDFEAILRSLGFRKNVVKRKPVTVAEPQTSPAPNAAATPEGTPDTTAPSPAPDSVSESREIAPAPADNVATVAEPSTANPDTTDAPSTAASDAVAPPSANAEQTASLSDVASPEEIEVTLWRPAPRRPKHVAKPAQKRDANQNRKPGAQKTTDRRDDRPGFKGKRRGQKHDSRGKGGRPQDGRNQQQHAAPRPPREKKADPNSPFAVLAGLKAELSGTQNNGKTKESEKTE